MIAVCPLMIARESGVRPSVVESERRLRPWNKNKINF